MDVQVLLGLMQRCGLVLTLCVSGAIREIEHSAKSCRIQTDILSCKSNQDVSIIYCINGMVTILMQPSQYFLSIEKNLVNNYCINQMR